MNKSDLRCLAIRFDDDGHEDEPCGPDYNDGASAYAKHKHVLCTLTHLKFKELGGLALSFNVGR